MMSDLSVDVVDAHDAVVFEGHLVSRSLYFGTLPGRGIAPGAISIDSTTISIDAADFHDEKGVVLPRG
jgi:hypothetical protein